VTLSHLEFAIEAGEDFERDVNGAGSTEALNCASFLWVLFGDILGHGGTHVDDEYIGRHCAIPNQFSAFRRLQVAWVPYMASRVC
jgi:hypothetical protein